MNHKLIRALVSSTWLIREEFAGAHVGLVSKFLNGEADALSTMKSSHRVSMIENNSPKSNKTVAVLPISDVIMKDDFCGTMGTKSMIEELKRLDNDPAVGAAVLDFDTPGGESTLLYNFYEQVISMNETTPVLAFYSGQLCSAGYYMASGAVKIYASSKIDEVGSIGTMCQLLVPNKDSKNAAPYTVKAIYASKSTEKNLPYHQAIEGKDDLLRTSQLDPINELFHQSVLNSRPKIDESVLAGACYFSEEALSKGMIDGIKSLDEVIREAFTLINDNEMKLFNRKQKQKSMQNFEKISAILGREVNETSTFSAEEMAKINSAMENAGNAENDETISNEQFANLNSKLDTVAAATESVITRLEALEAKPGAEETKLTPKEEQKSEDKYSDNPWDDPNSKLNQAAAKALGDQ